jgi:hypothetical protein
MSYYDTPFKSLEFQWPFLGFIYQGVNLMLVSAHIPKTIFKFNLPRKNEKLVNIFISHRLEIYYATISDGKRFNVYSIAGAEQLLNIGTENFN